MLLYVPGIETGLQIQVCMNLFETAESKLLQFYFLHFGWNIMHLVFFVL